MEKITFKGKSYQVRNWLDLTGLHWLKITEQMENGAASPPRVPTAIRNISEVLSPKSMRDYGQWSLPERFEFFRLVLITIELPLGSDTIRRYNSALPALVEVIGKHYAIQDGDSATAGKD